MRLLMLSVHRSLLKYESEMLTSLGHEVCTIHDLWNGNYDHANEQNYATPPREPLPSWHSCRLRKFSASEADILALKQIDLRTASFGEVRPNREALEAVLRNFDAVYVQMVPAWLMAYGVPMLEAGKKVFLRVFGHSFSELGHVHVNNAENVSRLSRYPNMTLVPVLETETCLWDWWKGRLVTIMAATCPNLLKKYAQGEPGRSGILSIDGYFDEGFQVPRMRERGINWRHVDFSKSHVSDEELANAIAGAMIYVDFRGYHNIIKYSTCEAIALQTPVLIPNMSGATVEMDSDGVKNMPMFCYADLQALYEFLERYLKQPSLLEEIKKSQQEWFQKKQALARERWSDLMT